MMLKKWTALIIAMMLMLTGAAFAAESSEQTMMQMYINPQLLSMLGAMDTETNDVLKTIVDTVNGMSWTVTKDEGVCRLDFAIHENEVYDYTVTADEKALHVFSSLFPNTAVKVNFEKLEELAQRILENEQVQALLGTMIEVDKAASAAQMEALAAALPAYMEDFEIILDRVMEGAQSDEANTYVYIPITDHQGADLFVAWLTRLKADEALLPIADQLLTEAGVTAEMGMTTVELLDALVQSLQEEKSAEAAEIASVGMYTDETGGVTYEVTMGNMLLIAVDLYEMEGGIACTDVMLVSSAYGTEDWQATYNGIMDGSNVDDYILGLNMARETAEDYDYNYALGYLVAAGSQFGITVETENTNVGAADWKEVGILSLDIISGEQELNLGGFAWESKLVEKLQIPSLEGKYVMDPLAFPLDLMLNGLPDYVEKLEKAAPEFMQLCEQLVNQLLEEAGLSEMTTAIGVIGGSDGPTEIIVEVQENTETTTQNSVKTGIEDM